MFVKKTLNGSVLYPYPDPEVVGLSDLQCLIFVEVVFGSVVLIVFLPFEKFFFVLYWKWYYK